MDFSLFKKIINEASETLELIYLHLAGEPLLHPKLLEMVEFSKKKKIPVGLSTNVTLLDERYSKQLINSNLDYLILSFDGFTPATYQAIRRGANFHKILSNIETFLKIKGPRGKRPFTLIQFVYMEKNKKEVDKFFSFWDREEIDAVRVKPFMHLSGLDTNLGAIDWTRTDKPCFLLWRELAIYWDGIAVPCCFDYIAQNPIGDLKKQSLREVWNSPAMQGLRERHLERKINTLKLCQKCERPHINIWAILGTVLLDNLTVKELLPIIEKKAITGKLKNLSYF